MNKLWGFHSATALKLRSDMKPSIKRSWSSGMILPSGGRGRRFDSGGAPFYFFWSPAPCVGREKRHWCCLARSVVVEKQGRESQVVGYHLLWDFSCSISRGTSHYDHTTKKLGCCSIDNKNQHVVFSWNCFCTSSSMRKTREFFSQTETENYSIQKSTGARGRVT